jgi:hypothetical protein
MSVRKSFRWTVQKSCFSRHLAIFRKNLSENVPSRATSSCGIVSYLRSITIEEAKRQRVRKRKPMLRWCGHGMYWRGHSSVAAGGN